MVRISLFRFPAKLRRRARRNRLSTMLVLLALTALLVLPFYIIYKPPRFVINSFARRWPDVLWQVETRRKVVALTIDDAPSQYTGEIVKILAENDAHATFFVIGSQIDSGLEALSEALRGGNELGNHAMHDEPSRSLSDNQLENELRSVKVKMRGVYGYEDMAMPANYFRPGSGFFSDRMRRLADKLGFRIVLGSIYPHDPQIPYWRVNSRHILSMLRPGAIIICHDRRGWTVPMLRRVLPEIRRRGYEVVTITELLKEGEAEEARKKEEAAAKAAKQT